MSGVDTAEFGGVSARREARVDLLTSIWPRLRGAIAMAAPLGADWFAMSTAFERVVEGDLAAHAGVLRIPMVIDGMARDVAGIHAVCTAPGFRARGLARGVIEEAIAFAEGFTETIVLHANDAAVYGRFGFRAVEQWVWWTDVARRERATPMRRLSAKRAEDVAAVHAAFVGRVPVSDALGIGEARELFVLDEVLACDGFSRLWIAEDLGVVVACDLEDRLLQIYDVVGSRWPALAEIVARAPGRVDRVEVFFAPDRWNEVAWKVREGRPVDVLMVRGAFTDAAIAVPPLARC